VRQTSLLLLEELHTQMGPKFKALIQSQISESTSSAIKKQIEKVFDQAKYDQTLSKSPRAKKCITMSQEGSNQINSNRNDSIGIDIPRMDLVANLSDDCITRLVNTYQLHTIYLLKNIIFLTYLNDSFLTSFV